MELVREVVRLSFQVGKGNSVNEMLLRNDENSADGDDGDDCRRHEECCPGEERTPVKRQRDGKRLFLRMGSIDLCSDSSLDRTSREEPP